MTNAYDSQDLDQIQQYQSPSRRETDAGSIRSRLISNLQASMTDAQDLANVYSNLARQLELQIVLVETKR